MLQRAHWRRARGALPFSSPRRRESRGSCLRGQKPSTAFDEARGQPGAALKLAVGHRRHADRLLQRHGLFYAFVLHGAKTRRIERAFLRAACGNDERRSGLSRLPMVGVKKSVSSGAFLPDQTIQSDAALSKILIVDDSDTIRSFTAAAVRMMKLESVLADCGEQALRAVRSRAAGPGAARRQRTGDRRLPETARREPRPEEWVPIIFLSKRRQRTTRTAERAIGCGGDDYTSSKPVQPRWCWAPRCARCSGSTRPAQRW